MRRLLLDGREAKNAEGKGIEVEGSQGRGRVVDGFGEKVVSPLDPMDEGGGGCYLTLWTLARRGRT